MPRSRGAAATRSEPRRKRGEHDNKTTKRSADERRARDHATAEATTDSLQLFINSAMKYPLLTGPEEIELMPFAARLDYLGLLDLWIKNRPAVMAWWALAREWPSFKTGLRDLISEAEFSEMRTHGPKIANDVAEIIAKVRHNTLAAVH